MLVVPSGHLQSESLIIDLGKASIFQQLPEALLNFIQIGLSLEEAPLAELQANLLKVDMTELINKRKYGIEILQRSIIDMGRMEPEAFDTLLGILDDIVTNLLEELIIGQVKPTEIDLQHLDALASGQHSSDVAEEIVQHFLLCEVPIPQAFQLDVRYLAVSVLISNVLLEFLELGLTAEEVGTAYVQLGDLSGVKQMRHMPTILLIIIENQNESLISRGTSKWSCTYVHWRASNR